MSETIDVIVVDDSAFMRTSLSRMLESDPSIKVVATARDGSEGIRKIRELHPDLVTMDIEMPVMDGLSALRVIMKEMPLPVLMVSSATSDGAQATLDALHLGAVDFIPKDLASASMDIVKLKEELISKVKQIVRSRSLQFRLQRIRAATQGIRGSAAAAKLPAAHPAATQAWPRLRGLSGVVLGISTGGPFALLQTLPRLPADFPLGIAIVQHMPPRFTRTLAARLDDLSQVRVREAADGDRMEPGLVLIAPGGEHMTFTRNGGAVHVRISHEPAASLYRPCADIMMTSAVHAFNGPLLGVIMTGMGKDGLEGLKLIKNEGGYVVAQNEESCVVYGMPKAAVEQGVADLVVSLDDLPQAITAIVKG